MAEADAKQILATLLRGVGLGELVDDMWGAYTSGKITEQTPIDQIGFQLRDNESYKKRFPGNVALRGKNKPEFSITDYLRQEQAYKNAMQGRGLPAGFYDTTEKLGKFMENDISPAEISQRVEKGFLAVQDADPEVLRQLKEFYPDVSKGDIASFFMDPTVATDIIVNRAQVAQIGSEAKRQANIQLTETQAESLRKQGIEQPVAARGFARIAEEKQIYQALQTGEDAITQEEQIAGTFGTSAAAAQRIEQRKRKRKAEFEAGGGFLASQAGSIGLGTVGE